MSTPIDERHRPLPEHVTQPLLSRLTAETQEEEYRQAARRRRSGSGSGKHRTTAFLAALFGLMVVVAVVQTSRNAAVTEAGRQELIRQITIARDDLADQQDQVSDLRSTNQDLQERFDRLDSQAAAAEANLASFQSYAGYAPVTGPAVRIRVDDAPDGSDDGVVRDEDLALLIDGLWAAGAEAISVNGQRLTTLSSIRSVNSAIHVGTVPLKPPYVVLAIGDPDTLQSLFTETSAAGEFFGLRAAYGFEFEMESAGRVTLNGRARPRLRTVEPYEKVSQNSEVKP